ncbi:MAG: hypothetical protein HQL63_06540 [Magnetococcales bacterium]|nr:hypothetical protein [Magnetococcales bacterium]
MPEIARESGRTAVVIVIEGLSVQEDPPLHTLCPPLGRWVSRGRRGMLAWPAAGSDATLEKPGLFALFGLLPEVLSGRDLPSGYHMARAMGLADDAGLGWAVLGFTHLRQVQMDLHVVSRQRTGQNQAEVAALAQALAEEYLREGWRIHPGMGMELLLSTTLPLQVRTFPLAHLEGRRTLDLLPQGADAASLLRLLTTGQLILARHPLNQERQAQGRLPLNTPWIWGVGRDHGEKTPPPPTTRGVCWSAEPLVASLAHSDGWRPCLLDDEEQVPTALLPDILDQVARGDRALVHLQAPALLVQHGLPSQRKNHLRMLGDLLLAPLAAALRPLAVPLVVLSGPCLAPDGMVLPEPSPWLMPPEETRSTRPWFWPKWSGRRGDILAMANFRQAWMA